jgi:hypothetical protein
MEPGSPSGVTLAEPHRQRAFFALWTRTDAPAMATEGPERSSGGET